MLKRIIYIFLFAILLFGKIMPTKAASLLGEKDEYVIVIDPGHGGDNLGTTSNESFSEKEITMKTALALVEELSKYEGVTVYLTHEEDVDLSLKDRAVFAEKVNADFLFSIHYNASEYHTMFGTEVWIPLEAPFHAVSYQFAYLQQLEMQELGLFSRGIKTRTNDNGKDYYGIIRESVARDIPAVIIEHCYVDEDRDGSYVDSDADFTEFGKRDAIAIAKFLGLDETGNSMPDWLQNMQETDKIADTYEDFTAPELCEIEVENADYNNCLLTVKVNASDKDTSLMYYDYSMDGGSTYSKLYPWPYSNMLQGTYDKEFSLVLNVPNGTIPQVVFRAYNKFDIYQKSNILDNLFFFEQKIEPTAAPEITMDETDVVDVETVIYEDVEEATAKINLKRFLVLGAFVLFWIILLALFVCVINRFLGKGKRH